MSRSPFFLSPVLKYPIWGGNKLAGIYKKAPESCTGIGESWELCAREQESSLVRGGAWDGVTLRELIAAEPALIGDAHKNRGFPLLIKFLDAGSDLSIQIHPSDSVAAELGEDCGKTEMWYIIEADIGAYVLAGVNPNVSDREFLDRVASGEDPTDLMKKHFVKAGDVIFIPAGMPHAIGAGILLAEIQQNSDTTYRVYDYGRGRELHTKEAMRAYHRYSDEDVSNMRLSGFSNSRVLSDCEYFQVSLLDIDGEESYTVDDDRFSSLLVISGEGELCSGTEGYELRAGDSVFLPAGMGKVLVRGRIKVIISK